MMLSLILRLGLGYARRGSKHVSALQLELGIPNPAPPLPKSNFEPCMLTRISKA